MTTPSIKNASTAEIETAIAQALAKLTGWENCSVTIETTQFKTDGVYSGERVGFSLSARFTPAVDKNALF